MMCWSRRIFALLYRFASYCVETLEAANYPVRDINVVYHSEELAEITATLVSQSIEPAELDAVVASLADQPGVHQPSWHIRALP